MRVTSILGAAAVLSGAAAEVLQGFNCGSTTDTGATKVQADFEKEFETSQNLEGAPGKFNAIRLYTNIQAGTTDTPIEAFAAAISKQTKLLLGVWSSGTDNIDNELKALSTAVEKYGTKLTDLIVALSIGSEDLYRDSNAGRVAKAGVGNDAANIVKFIKDARSKLAGTPLASVPITHVDTWTAWVNGSNKVVIDEIDFLSVNAFPFYESEHANEVKNGGSLLNDAITATEGVAGGKEVWITETGWAYSGPSFGAGVASVDNAEAYWKDVGCALFGKRNAFWYTLRDANPANEVKFAITDNLSTTPRFDLSCSNNATLSSSTNSTTNSTSSSSGGSGSNGSGPGSSSNSTGSASGSNGTTSAGGSGTSGVNGSVHTGSAVNSAGLPQSTGAGAILTVNSMAVVLSGVFAMAAWAL